MSAEERRSRIILAVIPLFARVGFKGVTTKMLAQEAGISEALLYQHFSSKEAIYAEVQDFVCRPTPALEVAVKAVEDGTSKFMHLVVLMLKFVVDNPHRGHAVQSLFPRIMINSVIEDGVFAKMHTDRYLSQILTPMKASFEIARQRRELSDDQMPDDLRFWLCQHTIVALNLFSMGQQKIVDYKCGEDELLAHTARYVLRGIGVTDAAMEKYFDFPRIKATVESWLTLAFRG